MNLGNNIKKIRNSQNITQKELAEKLKVSIRTIQNYESGNREPSFDILLKISKALNVNIHSFLDLDKVYTNNTNDPESLFLCEDIDDLILHNESNKSTILNIFKNLIYSIQALYLPKVDNPKEYQDKNIVLLDELLYKIHNFIELDLFISPTKQPDVFDKESIYLIHEISSLLKQINSNKITAEKLYDDRSE